MFSTFETCAEEIQAANDFVFLVTKNMEHLGFADVVVKDDGKFFILGCYY